MIASRTFSWGRFSTDEWRTRVAIAAAGLLVGFPMVLTIGSAFGLVNVPGSQDDGSGLGPLRAIMKNYTFWTDVFHTLLLAVGGIIGATIVGTLLAFLLTRTNTPGARGRALSWIPLLSFLLPATLVFFAWHVLYASRAGLVNIFLRNLPGTAPDEGPIELLSVPVVILAMTVFMVPIIFISVRGALAAASPELEQAARISGASFPKVVRTITLPLVKSAIGAGALLGLVLGFGAYLIPALLRIPQFRTVSMDLKTATETTPQAFSQAAAWSMVLLLLSLTALVLRHKWVGQQAHSMPLRQSAATEANRRVDIGRWKWLGLAVFLLYGLFAGVLPVLGVLSLSLRGFWSTTFNASDFSLDNYRQFSEFSPFAMEALKNSVLAAIFGATLAVAVGVWFARRIAFGGRPGRLLEGLTFLPSGVPPIIIGLSFLVGTVKWAPGLYGGLLPLLIAYLVILLPFSVQIPLAALRRVPREFEWASAVSGASRRTTMRRIVLPLVLVDLVGAWTLVAVIMVREVEASIMLAGEQFRVAGPEMLSMWQEGQAPSAAAFGMVLLISTIGLAALGGLVAAGISAYSRFSATQRIRAARRVSEEGVLEVALAQA